MARPSLGWATGTWLTVCAGLAAVVAYQLVSSFPLAPTVTAAPPNAQPLEFTERPEPPRTPRDDAVDEIAARPLFSADRRPYEPPPEPVQEVVPTAIPSVPLELAGIFVSEADKAALVLVSDNGNPPAWLREGQSIEGWRVATIEQDRVLLRQGEQERELRLREDKEGPALATRAAERSNQNQSRRQQAANPQPAQSEAGLRDIARSLDDQRDEEEDEERD